MNTTSITKIVIGVIVGAIMVSAILIPVAHQAQNDIQNIHYNGDNPYCVRMSYGTPEANLHFCKPAGEMYVKCYMGDAVEPYYIAPLNSVGQLGWVFVSSSYSFGITGYGSQPADYTAKYNNSGSAGHINVANETNVSINVTTGKITTWGSDPNSTWNYYDTADVTKMFWADPEGDYINVNAEPSSNVYIEDPKEISGSSMTQGNYVFYTDTDNVQTTANKSAVISTETTENDGLYHLTKVPMTITGTDDSVSNVTSGHVIVKYKVQGTPDANADELTALIGVIPTLVVVGIIVGVVALAFSRRE